MRRAWAGVVKEAGLGPEVTPHVLRHTCVSWLLWKGWTAWEVGKHVGATEAEIDKTYGHYMPTEDGRARA